MVSEKILVPLIEYITDLERREQIMYVSGLDTALIPTRSVFSIQNCQKIPLLGTKGKRCLYICEKTEKPFVALLFSQLYLRPLAYFISRYIRATPGL